jgi:uncharacterized Ntn-hydrolase superfamily protein
MNPLYVRDGLALFDQGVPAAALIARLVEADGGRDARQVHAIDAEGRTAAHTGRACIEWCGHRAGEGYSLAGNMLAGPQVLEATARSYEANASLPFARRLIVAMQAGEDAGGDRRGKQAAAVRIHTSEPHPFIDLRVDDHAEPLLELARLYEVSLERYQPFWSCLPSSADPVGITDRNAIEARVRQFQEKAVRGKA